MNYTYLFICYSSMFILGLIDNSRGPIYPELLSYFSITNSSGSLIFSLSSLVSFFVVFMNKHWLLKIGLARSLQSSFLLHFFACLIFGSALSDLSGYIVFLIGCTLFGVAIGIQSISLNIILGQVVNASNRRRAFSGLHSMYGIASLLAPFIIAEFYLVEIAWQTYFIHLSLVPLFFFFVSLKLSSSGFSVPNVIVKVGLSEGLILGLIFALYVTCEVLVSSRLVVYLQQVEGFSSQEAAFSLGMFFGCLLFGRMLFTIIHFKVNSLKLLIASLVSSIVVILLGLYVDAKILFLSGLTMSYFFPAGLDYIMSTFGERSEGIIARIMIYVGGSIAFMHILFGFLTDYIGMRNTWLLVPIMLFIALYLTTFKLKKLTAPR